MGARRLGPSFGPSFGRSTFIAAIAVATTVGVAAPAMACGGLIGPNGAVNLVRTSTFAGYHDGVEHYLTAFKFVGGGGAFGSLVPLPGLPTKVERGGDWTLQRLARETAPVQAFRAEAATAGSAADAAVVVLTAKVDALDITVLKGGGAAVGAWATEHGFRLPPDAPEVLDFYADRSPYFMAAAFDPERAAERKQGIGDGTPVHLTIPTDNPWVPLRILGLGKSSAEPVEADVYLLTDHRPSLLPAPGRGKARNGLRLEYDQAASKQLLQDLRTDKGGEWVPQSGWLTKLAVDSTAGLLIHDLAIDASRRNRPSRTAAFGITAAGPTGADKAVAAGRRTWPLVALAAGVLLAAAGALTLPRAALARRRSDRG